MHPYIEEATEQLMKCPVDVTSLSVQCHCLTPDYSGGLGCYLICAGFTLSSYRNVCAEWGFLNAC